MRGTYSLREVTALSNGHPTKALVVEVEAATLYLFVEREWDDALSFYGETLETDSAGGQRHRFLGGAPLASRFNSYEDMRPRLHSWLQESLRVDPLVGELLLSELRSLVEHLGGWERSGELPEPEPYHHLTPARRPGSETKQLDRQWRRLRRAFRRARA